MQFSTKTLNQKSTPKVGYFGFFQLIKNYAETKLLIDEEYISQVASYTNHQDFGFYIAKITFLDYRAKRVFLIQVFGDLNLRELCWAV